MESRSTFVTVLAWIFIVGAGFSSFVSIMQVVMVSTMLSGEEFRSIPENTPAFAKFMQKYFLFFIYGFGAVTIFTFISSIALLKRKNWARLAFVVLLSLGVFWQVGGLVMQFTMFPELPNVPFGKGLDDFEHMRNIIRWFSFVVCIGISGLFIWIIKKLVTQPIIGEFTPTRRDAA